MTSDSNDAADSTRLGRRKYLTLGALAAAGLAGCSSGDGETTPTATATEPQSPEALTRQFYTTLYGDDDIEGTNALFHPDSPSPPLEAAGFEAYGGLENIDTEVNSVSVVSEGDDRATVHATVEYTLPNGPTTATDYMYLRRDGQQWRVNSWLPEAPRRQMATGTVETFYQTLYNQNDLEGANAMYHPDNDGGPLEASSFEPYGGLENIETTVQSTEIVSEDNGEAEIHADVQYATPSGTNTATDYVFLRLHNGRWRIDSWLPEAVRESGTADG